MAEVKGEQMLRKEVEELIQGNIKDRKQQVVDFFHWLDRLDLYQAPASASYHYNFPGGLVQHSLEVTKTLLRLKRSICAPGEEDGRLNKIAATDESCVIVGLLHDVHKLTDGFGRQYYMPNVLKSGKVSEAKPYEINKEMVAICGGYSSALIVSKHIDLYEHEIQAIACHDGQYAYENRGIAAKEHPLTMLLHFADVWNAFLIEKEDSWLYRDISEKMLQGKIVKGILQTDPAVPEGELRMGTDGSKMDSAAKAAMLNPTIQKVAYKTLEGHPAIQE